MDEIIEKIKTGQSSPEELKHREDIYQLFRDCPIPEYEIMRNLGLFINRQTMSRYLFFHEL